MGCDPDWSKEACKEVCLYARHVYASAPLGWIDGRSPFAAMARLKFSF